MESTILIKIISLNMKKSILRLKNYLKLSKVIVKFVVVINHKFLLSKWLEADILLKMLNLQTDIDQLCQFQRDVI